MSRVDGCGAELIDNLVDLVIVALTILMWGDWKGAARSVEGSKVRQSSTMSYYFAGAGSMSVALYGTTRPVADTVRGNKSSMMPSRMKKMALRFADCLMVTLKHYKSEVQSRAWVCTSVVCLSGLGEVPTKADSLDDFYRGKQISIIVPTPPGGGYDVYARFLARYIGRYVPGHPAVIVRNQPGAGGLVAANYLANVAPPDGLTLEIFASTITHKQLAKSPGVQLDVRQLAWVGNMSIASSVCALSGSAARLSTKDLFTTEVVVGGTTGLPSVMPRILNGLAGTKFNVVEGYASTPALLQSMEAGEINGICGWGWDSARIIGKDLFGRGVAGVKLDVALTPHPELQAAHVPFLLDFVSDGDRKEALKLALSTQVYNRAFAMSGHVPSDRVAAMRHAFVATLQDKTALAEADQLGLEIRYLSPEGIAQAVESEFSAPVAIQTLAVDELRKAGF